METLHWRVEDVDTRSPLMARIDRLVYEVLYRDFGVEEDAHWHVDTRDVLQVAALDGQKLMGGALLLGVPGDASRQLRQLVVEPAVRGMGVGRALVEGLEERALAQGSQYVWLNARHSAFEFYQRMGYEYTSELFESELTGLPHRTMRKLLGTASR